MRLPHLLILIALTTAGWFVMEWLLGLAGLEAPQGPVAFFAVCLGIMFVAADRG